MRVAILYNRDFEFLAEDPGREARADVANVATAVQRAIQANGGSTRLVGLGASPLQDLEELASEPPDVAVNLCESLHGDARGESLVPLALDLWGIPYTGSGALSLTMALHKPKAKEILRARGIPTPEWRVVSSADQTAEVDLPFPLIVKPSREDASAGIHRKSVVHDPLALATTVADVVREFNQPALVEQYIAGREIYVSLLGSPAIALPLSEIDFTALPAGVPQIVTYAGKWDADSVECTGTPSVESNLAGLARDRAVATASRAFEALECRDYGRVDLRVQADGQPYVIDINPNCDLSPTAGFARAATSGGIDYASLIDRLVQLARRRALEHRSASQRHLRPDSRPDLRVVGAG